MRNLTLKEQKIGIVKYRSTISFSMTKYKCPEPGCKYVSEEPGDCCNQDLVTISEENGNPANSEEKSHNHSISGKKSDNPGKSGENSGLEGKSGCSCC